MSTDDFTLTARVFPPKFKRVQVAYYPLFGKLWATQEKGEPEWSGLHHELLSAVKKVRGVFENIHHDELTFPITYEPLRVSMDRLRSALDQLAGTSGFEELIEFHEAFDAWYRP